MYLTPRIMRINTVVEDILDIKRNRATRHGTTDSLKEGTCTTDSVFDAGDFLAAAVLVVWVEGEGERVESFYVEELDAAALAVDA